MKKTTLTRRAPQDKGDGVHRISARLQDPGTFQQDIDDSSSSLSSSWKSSFCYRSVIPTVAIVIICLVSIHLFQLEPMSSSLSQWSKHQSTDAPKDNRGANTSSSSAYINPPPTDSTTACSPAQREKIKAHSQLPDDSDVRQSDNPRALDFPRDERCHILGTRNGAISVEPKCERSRRN